MFEDFQRSANLAVDPDTYELENDAIARDGRLDAALAEVAPWAGRDLVDVGCGNGYWLPRYAETARLVVGVEPDSDLLPVAQARVNALVNARAEPGSAEQLPFDDASVDVAHARFAYFYGEGCEQGLAEVLRVLRPGGVLAVIDNDWGWGEFASLLQIATTGNAAIDPHQVHSWWTMQGATRTDVRAGWHAKSADELERILRLEFPGDVIDEFLAGRAPDARLSYGYAVFTIKRPV